MHCVRKVTEDLYWVGANDHRLALFENIHPIPRGVSYNAYVLLDEKTVLFDTADWSVCRQFLENVDAVLSGRPLDYLVINHVEPDHAASIAEILLRHPETVVISNEKAFMLMRQFGFSIDSRYEEVKEGDIKSFGKHTVTFVAAPMVHWPEAMVTFDTTNGVLFSADAFGTFGAIDGKLFNDEVNFDRNWIDEARRYYTNIVGKYGPHVQYLLKKAAGIDIKIICPLHGLVWRNNLGYFIDKYMKWSTYEPEEKGVLLVYASMYGNTESAASLLATKLVEKGMTNVSMYDVSNTDISYLISETFRLSHIVFASVTYNLGIYPKMHNYLMDMKALNIQNRTAAILENGSWACTAGSLIRKFLDEELKGITVLDDTVTLNSAMTTAQEPSMDDMVASIIDSMK
ncbi:MAG: FprA family A-type flavoprotein [Megasphaera sp.]|jgi:flavorubredoxin|uniref:FprA family A-type flavoprotein n=1 Tax=Megasphaera sueciensis TaxID=349094 RepID=UPI003CFEECE4|nr:FprA family A-type flavoprotein [Megasphaera sp.]MCI1822399.1 FprA family A-type flavoprotein [Megasphaera sp.]